MAISAAAFPAAARDLGPMRRGTFLSEMITITGSTGAVGDQTSAYRLKYVHKNPVIVGGSFAIASSTTDIAGTSIVIEARVQLANNSVVIEVTGDM